jgi:hypothetical protein
MTVPTPPTRPQYSDWELDHRDPLDVQDDPRVPRHVTFGLGLWCGQELREERE